MVAKEVLGLDIWRFLGILYADNGVVGLQDLEWLQGALNVLI